MKTKVYAPGHITGFFKIYSNGSTGGGINIEKGITTTVKAKEADGNKIRILVNGKKTNAATSRNVVEKFLELEKKKYEIEINHQTTLPIGYGLGLSGSGALSLSLALNKALGTGLKKRECVDIARRAEIEEGTGLGDVIAEQFSGLIIGKRPYPSKDVYEIPIKEKYIVMGFLRPIETKKIIKNKGWKEKINRAGESCMREMAKGKSLGNFVRLCNKFSTETGLARGKIRKAIEETRYASMAMLGQTLFIITNNPNRAKKALKKYTKRIAVSEIATWGARLL